MHKNQNPLRRDAVMILVQRIRTENVWKRRLDAKNRGHQESVSSICGGYLVRLFGSAFCGGQPRNMKESRRVSFEQMPRGKIGRRDSFVEVCIRPAGNPTILLKVLMKEGNEGACHGATVMSILTISQFDAIATFKREFEGLKSDQFQNIGAPDIPSTILFIAIGRSSNVSSSPLPSSLGRQNVWQK
ncbi:hypothetical protein BC830DRAFT_1081490 [Chytriomyces sp. MP71]|nr:hypothetical protein BC830DRAFT_1081490 [Chytriomyces sp. MP71]